MTTLRCLCEFKRYAKAITRQQQGQRLPDHTAAAHRNNLPHIRANLDDRATLKLARSFHVPVLLNSNTRDGSLRQAAGELGEIRKVVVEYNQGWLASHLEGTGNKQADWRGDPAKAGPGGALGDIATLTAGEMISEDLGIKLETVTLGMLGQAKKVTIDKDNTTIVDGAGDHDAGGGCHDRARDPAQALQAGALGMK